MKFKENDFMIMFRKESIKEIYKLVNKFLSTSISNFKVNNLKSTFKS